MAALKTLRRFRVRTYNQLPELEFLTNHNSTYPNSWPHENVTLISRTVSEKMIKIIFRYTNLEFWVDDKLVSKTSKSFQLSHTHSDMFIKDVLIGWNTRNKLQICNDCESTQTGSRFKFIWTGGEYGKTWQHDGQLKEFWGNDPYPAALGRIEFSYRDPGENIYFLVTQLLSSILNFFQNENFSTFF